MYYICTNIYEYKHTNNKDRLMKFYIHTYIIHQMLYINILYNIYLLYKYRNDLIWSSSCILQVETALYRDLLLGLASPSFQTVSNKSDKYPSYSVVGTTPSRSTQST